MRNLHTIAFLIFLAFVSCERETDEVKTNELDIALKSTSSISPSGIKSFDIYPNPFNNILFISQSGYTSVKLYISRSDGAEKKYELENSGEIEIDFSNEKSGAYLIEGIFDDEFYREYVIKK